jgi:hypothetical protein
MSRGLPPGADGQDSPAAPLGEEAGDDEGERARGQDEDDGPGGERGRSAMPSGTPVRTTLAATTGRPRACQVAACCRSSRSWASRVSRRPRTRASSSSTARRRSCRSTQRACSSAATAAGAQGAARGARRPDVDGFVGGVAAPAAAAGADAEGAAAAAGDDTRGWWASAEERAGELVVELTGAAAHDADAEDGAGGGGQEGAGDGEADAEVADEVGGRVGHARSDVGALRVGEGVVDELADVGGEAEPEGAEDGAVEVLHGGALREVPVAREDCWRSRRGPAPAASRPPWPELARGAAMAQVVRLRRGRRAGASVGQWATPSPPSRLSPVEWCRSFALRSVLLVIMRS